MKRVILALLGAFLSVSAFAQPVVSSVIYVPNENQYYFIDSSGSKYSAVKLTDGKWSPVYNLSAWAKDLPFRATNEVIYVPTENVYYVFDVTGTKYVTVKGDTFEVGKQVYTLKQFAEGIPFASISAAIYVPQENQYYFFNETGSKYVAIKGGVFKTDGSVYELKQFAAIPFSRIVASVYIPSENQFYFFSHEGKYVTVKGADLTVSPVYTVSQFAPGGPKF